MYIHILGVPTVCMNLLTDSVLTLIHTVRSEKESMFAQLVRVWELGREIVSISLHL
jgi:hypothetical protein